METDGMHFCLIGAHYSATLDIGFACFVSYLAFSLSLLDMAVAYAIWLASLFRWPNCRGVSDSACLPCQMIPCWCQPEFLPRPAATATLMWPLTTQPCVINGAISPTADSFQRTDWWCEKVQVPICSILEIWWTLLLFLAEKSASAYSWGNEMEEWQNNGKLSGWYEVCDYRWGHFTVYNFGIQEPEIARGKIDRGIMQNVKQTNDKFKLCECGIYFHLWRPNFAP